jgi:hypothetical protein
MVSLAFLVALKSGDEELAAMVGGKLQLEKSTQGKKEEPCQG